jgi:outer membrane immunogenic protein
MPYLLNCCGNDTANLWLALYNKGCFYFYIYGAHQMKKLAIIVAAIAAFEFTGSAFAADMPTKMPTKAPMMLPVYNWTGIYVGINGGGMWNRYNWTNTIGTTSGDFNGSGAVLGGTLGANWQMPGTAWVLGIEGDWDWANSKTTSGPSGACGIGCETDVKWVATLRGRVGYAVIDRLLVYATGGAAWAKFSPSIGGTVGFVDYTQSGWTAGGGVEYAIWDRWSVKAEYLYVGLQTSPVFFAGSGITTTNRMSVARLGLNYRF